MSSIKSALLSISLAFIVIYIGLFILYCIGPLDTINNTLPINVIFVEFKYVIPAFILAALNFFYLGKIAAVDEVRYVKSKYQSAINGRIDDLTLYINLAKTVTKSDANKLVADFIDKLDEKYGK